MADLITPAILAVNIGCGLVTNFSQAGGVRAYRKVASVLSRGKPRENHDILKATHTAYVAAMEVMAASAKQVAAGGPTEEKEAAKRLKALCSDPAFRGFRYDGEHFPLAEVNEAIDRLFSGGLGKADGLAITSEDIGLNRLVVTDLEAWGVPLPPSIETVFVEGLAGLQPWHIVFRAAFAEQVKANGTAFRILTFERLGELRAIGLTLIDEVEGIHDRLDRIEEMLRQILRRLPAEVPAALTLGAATLGVMVLVPSLYERADRPTLKVEPGLSNMVSPAPPPAYTRPILDALPGMWGEADCRARYAFSVQGRDVVVHTLNSGGVSSGTWVGTIAFVEDNMLLLSYYRPDYRPDHGPDAHLLRGRLEYNTERGTERLTWYDPSGMAPAQFVRCDGDLETRQQEKHHLPDRNTAAGK